MTSAIGGVPASNFAGGGAKVVRSSVTVSIMSPPPCQGGIASSRAARPYSTPMPVGPKSLWPENAKKSQSSACTSTGRCGADWAPSTSVTMPRSRAVRHHPPHRIDRAQRVRQVGHGEQARAVGEQALERRQIELARFGDRHRADRGARLRRHQLPGDDVRVVLHLGDQDLVAGLERCAGPSSGPRG